MERLAREVSQPEQLGALVDASFEATVQLGDQPIDMAQLRFCPSQRYPPMTGISRAVDECRAHAAVRQQQLALGFEFGSEVSRLLDVGALCRLNVKVPQSHRRNVTDSLESCHLGITLIGTITKLIGLLTNQPSSGSGAGRDDPSFFGSTALS